ncbi:MAG: heme A synthase [Cyanobacteria bacterium P01_A01_bin.135]
MAHFAQWPSRQSNQPSPSQQPSSQTAAHPHLISPAVTSIRRLVWKMAIATFVLMAIGSATRVMNAGLACPDWPLCYGTLVPTQQMNLQVFLEWIHRLDASLIGLMAIALVLLSWRRRQQVPSWLPWASVGALALVLVQGLLGGLTVTELLRFDIVTAHLGTALLFFTTLLTIGVLLLPRDQLSASQSKWLAPCSLAAAVLVYLQSLSGGLVGSQWALHQCLQLIQLCSVVNVHLLGIIPVTLTAGATAVLGWRSPVVPVKRLAQTVAGLLSVQLFLGTATFRLHLQVELLTIAHQVVAAALLGSLVGIAVYSLRDRVAAQSLSPSALH